MKTILFAALLTAATCLQGQVSTSPPTQFTTAVEAAGAGGTIPGIFTANDQRATNLPWSPQQATGAPDTPQPGDYSTAWASGAADQREELLTLEYAEPADLGSVRIYESYNPGAISKVVAWAENGHEVALVRDRSAPGEWTSEFRLPEGQELRARYIRITINEPAIPGYNEIDAVGLKAKDGTLQWAIAATASSFYGQGARVSRIVVGPKSGPASWSSAQATGAPNTPIAGDFGTAWAPSLPDEGNEWLFLTFAEPIRAKACEIYQSCAPGAITSVDLINAAGQPLATLQPGNGKAEERAGGIVVLSLPFDSTDAVKQVRVNLDTKLAPGWNEIDAVALADQSDNRHWATRAQASTAFGGESDGASETIVLEHAAEAREKLDSVRSVLSGAVSSFDPSAQVSEAVREKGAPWSPEQATEAPDTPVHGDFPTAWAPKTFGAGKEWLRVEFIEPADLGEVRVHDSNVPGAITSIAAVLAGGTEVPLRIDTPPQGAENQPQVVVGKCPEDAMLLTRTILITLDTKRAQNGWPEIDAVELVARNGSRQWATRATASSTYAETLGAWPKARAPFERAKTLEEANERMEQLNRRLRALEERLQTLSH